MKKLIFSFVILILLYLLFGNSLDSAGQTIAGYQYIYEHMDIALKEQRRTGVPAVITLAQGLREARDNDSLSELAKKSNNHFGIKCGSNWKGSSVLHKDDRPNECFRWYKTVEESYMDHSDFLLCSQRYAKLFALKPDDYWGWCLGLKKYGYATDPFYPKNLMYEITAYHLPYLCSRKIKGEDNNNDETEVGYCSPK